MSIRLDRREMLIGLGRSIAAALLAPAGASAVLAGETEDLLKLPVPRLDDPDNPPFAVFHRLCQWVTCRRDLDEAKVRTLYPIFRSEPWAAKHISTAYADLGKALERNGPNTSVPQLIAEGALDGPEEWFVSHLLTTWYLGVYYYEGVEFRVFYEDALMFEAISDFRPVPGLSNWDYGYWAEMPKAN